MNKCILRHFLLMCMSTLMLSCMLACSDLEYEAEKVEIIYEGKFVDSGPVEGLRYETKTQSGLTDSDGIFKYKKREYVTFYIGNVQLGDTVKAKELISSVDLVSGTVSVENNGITNMSRFLQGLGGSSSSNKIIITDEMTKIIQSQVPDNKIKFSVSPEAFEKDDQIKNIFNDLSETSSEPDSCTLVSVLEAQQKLKENLIETEGIPEYEAYSNTIQTPFDLYPIAGYFDRPEEIFISSSSDSHSITPDKYGGFREIIELQAGQANNISVTAFRYGQKIGELYYNITHNESIEYTPGHQILYSYFSDSSVYETIVIDLDAKNSKGLNGVIAGYISDINIVASSNDGNYLIDSIGQVYYAKNHETVGEPLPFSQTGAKTFYPLFSPDDHYCYAGTIKIDFEVWKAINIEGINTDAKWLYRHFPVWVDSRYATITDDERYLFQTQKEIEEKQDPVYANKVVFEVAEKVDLFTDEVVDTIDIPETNVVMRKSLGDMIISPDGSTGFLTTYSDFYGAIDIIDLNNKTAIKNIDGLSDFLGNTVFINDNKRVLFGSSGNSWYGGGNIYIITTDGNMLTRLNQLGVSVLQYGDNACGSSGYAACGQYGAFSVALDREELLYVSSRYIEELGSQKEIKNCSPDRRGIDQFSINNDGTLDYKQTYYLNYYDKKTTHFVK